MSVEVDSYDDVLEELYEKYKGKGGTMPPEMKLLFLVLASASAFHFSKSHLSNMPGLDKVMQNNPGFIPNMVNGNKQTSQFMTEQEINLEKQRKAMIEKEKEMRNKPKNPDVGTFNKNNYAPVNEVKQEEKKVDIKAPMNVQDILNRLHQSENNNTSETQDETSSNNDRIVGTSSLNSSEKRKGRKKKNIMSIS